MAFKVDDLIHDKAGFLLKITGISPSNSFDYTYDAYDIRTKDWMRGFLCLEENFRKRIKDKEYILINNSKLARLYLLEDLT